MDQEEWLTVAGYENRYEVSSHGRVRSLGFYSANRWGTRTWRAGRVLKPFLVHPHDYRAVTLTDAEGVQRTSTVHRLVLRAFAGAPPAGATNGLHADDDPANNRADNLRWGTRSQNAVDSVVNGMHVQARKDACGLGHLLVPPNLVESSLDRGGRSCLACKLSRANYISDQRLREQGGRERTRYNRGRDGFMRSHGEGWGDEADRRYAHIMRDHDGLL